MNTSTEHFRYVRVQDDLHGMAVDEAGNVLMACNPSATRNTMHFAINGVVGDHAYGRFNLHPDGALKGKVVVIADPEQMGTPAGFNQVDTWFRMGATLDEHGALQRQLDVGRATVVVPHGMDIPAGMNAVFYDGTIEGRDEAVAQTLSQQRIVQRQIGFRCWTDSNEGDALAWASATASKLYPGQEQYIHVGMHDCSPDGELEMVGIKGRIESFRQSGELFTVNAMGVSEKHLDIIERAANTGRSQIDVFMVGLDDAEFERCCAFYNHLREQLRRDLTYAQELAGAIGERQSAKRAVRVDIAQQLQLLAPHGEIYVADALGQRMEKIGPDEAAQRLMDHGIGPNDQVWIHGQTAHWQPVALSPMRDVYYQARGESGPALAGSSPPPLPVEPPNDALGKLRDAIDRGENGQELAKIFASAALTTEKEALHAVGVTIRSMAVLDGDQQLLALVESALSKRDVMEPAMLHEPSPTM